MSNQRTFFNFSIDKAQELHKSHTKSCIVCGGVTKEIEAPQKGAVRRICERNGCETRVTFFENNIGSGSGLVVEVLALEDKFKKQLAKKWDFEFQGKS